MHALFSTLPFLLATAFLFFIPGYVILWLCFRRGSLTHIERFLLAFALSDGLLVFLMIGLGKLHIRLGELSLWLGLLVSLILFAVIVLYAQKRAQKKPTQTIEGIELTQRQSWLIALLLLLTCIIKFVYMWHAVLPTATDLGHHMYWSKVIAESGALPNYAKIEVIPDQNGGAHLSSEPTPIADFIIGEHLPFAALALFSGASFFSAFPPVFLLLINLLSLLALLVLGWRIASDETKNNSRFPARVGILILFLFGPLYTLASPQAKFVSGGVVGNTLGNLFLPLILLMFYRALKEKRPGFLAISFFLTFTLAYTHHLSTLMLLFVLAGTAVVYLLFHFRNAGETLKEWGWLVLSPWPLTVLIACTLFFFLVAMPTYIETHAIGTALGTPTRLTRTGLTFMQIAASSGYARVALALAATLLVLASAWRSRYSGAFLLGWGIMLFLLTFAPHLLLINIPSNRIGAYLSFPMGFLAAFSLASLAELHARAKKSAVPVFLLMFIAFVSFAFASGTGLFDNSQTLLTQGKSKDTLETFHASQYLAARTNKNDIVLKDHNYIGAADSWIKLFFMRDYSYPLSRGLLQRYADASHEQCTLLMIASPNTQEGKACYTGTGTDLVMINPVFDATQFEKSPDFARVYASDHIHIYARH